MSGQTEVDIDDVLGGLDRMQRAAADLRPVWNDVRPAMKVDLGDHFGDRESPDGGWPQWAASTQERFLSKHRQSRIFVLSPRERERIHRRRVNVDARGRLTKGGARRLRNMLGRLKTAWQWSAGRLYIEAKSRVEWAPAHNEGATVGHGAHVPQRKFAWASDNLIDYARTLIEQRVAGAM